MTIRKTTRGGHPFLVIDISYRRRDGAKGRYRRDAQVQTMVAARAEERRLFEELDRTGEIKIPTKETKITAVPKRIRDDTSIAISFEAAALECFDESPFLGSMKKATRETYRECFEAVLSPKLGKIPVGELSKEHAQQVDGDLVKDRLSASRRRNVQITLRTLCRFFVERGYLVDRPRFPKLPKVGKKSLVPLRWPEVESIVAHATEHARTAFVLMAWAGLRPCEIRALSWKDVTLRKNVLQVRLSVSRDEVGVPKGVHERTVPIAGPLKEALEEARQRNRGNGLVSTTHRGEAWGEWGLGQAFRRAAKAAGIKGHSLYDLRHFFVTQSIRSGAPVPAVQKIVGHVDLATTQRYVDFVTDDLVDAIARLERGNSVETASRQSV